MNILYNIVFLLILVFSILKNVNMIFVLVIFMWTMLMFYSMKKLYRRSSLFSFLGCFFLFYLGREVLMQYFYYRVVKFSIETNRHFYTSLLISLISLGIGYVFFSVITNNKKEPIKEFQYKKYEKIIKILYYFLFIIAILSKSIVINYVMKYGYTGYYVGYDSYLRSNLLLYLMAKVEQCFPIVFAVYLSLLPNKNSTKKILITYFLYLILTLGSGQRSLFILGILVICIYMTKRQVITPSRNWVTTKKIKKLLFILPILIILLNIYGYYRVGQKVENISIFKLFYNFIYDQGITGNIIKIGYELRSNFNKEILYTLNFLREGILGILLNTKFHFKDPLDFALNSGKYGNAISYFMLGEMYFEGYGMGSSYIAEFYQDYGYLGIFLGNIMYSYFLVKIDNIKNNKNIILISIKLLLLFPILWSIRGSSSEIFIFLFSPITIMMVVFLKMLFYLVDKNLKYNLKRGEN